MATRRKKAAGLALLIFVYCVLRFVLRYPFDRIEVTGIIFEPWHFRYVGTELSLELKELGLYMEEYMAILTEQQNKTAG